MKKPQKRSRGAPRLGPGPKGERSPVLRLRVPTALLQTIRQRARLERRPVPVSVRARLAEPPP